MNVDHGTNLTDAAQSATVANTTEDRTADIHAAVRERYGRIALSAAEVAGGAESSAPARSCCGGEDECCATGLYDADAMVGVPKSAKALSLGSGNPLEDAELKAGETVVDLGSGGGIDVLRAAQLVGPEGRAIGVDMTPEMLERARAAAAEMGAANVDFLHGHIEHLPIEDNTADVVISNCVINLAPDKSPVFAEMYRALAPGGRIAVSDIVRAGDDEATIGMSPNDLESWAGCIVGAISTGAYRRGLEVAGFKDVRIAPRSSIDGMLSRAMPGTPYSARITAQKPVEAGAHSKASDSAEICCTAEGGVASRLQDAAGFLAKAVGVDPIESGYRIRFKAGSDAERAGLRAEIDAFAAEEAVCCPDIEFSLEENGAELELTVTAGPAQRSTAISTPVSSGCC